MTGALVVFFAGFASVFLLGFQSRNVNYGNYGWAAGTAFAIGIMQTTLWGALFRDLSATSAVIYACAGALAIVSSMYVHSRWVEKKP